MDNIINLANEIERSLIERYGPLLSGEDLRIALGYSSMQALRQALSRRTAPVPVFSLPQRRGKFALVKDIAIWLARQRQQVLEKS